MAGPRAGTQKVRGHVHCPEIRPEASSSWAAVWQLPSLDPLEQGRRQIIAGYLACGTLFSVFLVYRFIDIENHSNFNYLVVTTTQFVKNNNGASVK